MRITVNHRPRRSMLFMPASNARALDKAATLPADGLIFDLEDAVASDAKPAARVAAVAAANSARYGAREVLIRVNDLGSPWGEEDIALAASSAAHGLVLPKVNVANDIHRAEAALVRAGAREDLALWAMMETPRAVLSAADIAAASPRIAGLIVGTADLAKELRCAHPADRAPMLTALQLCVLAARAHNIAVLDGVHFDLTDAEGYAAVCRQGRALGFDGKTLIHPSQIDGANTIFAPSPEELARARRIIAAHDAALAKGEGVALLDGRLVEALHVEEAQRLLAHAAAIAALGQPSG